MTRDITVQMMQAYGDFRADEAQFKLAARLKIASDLPDSARRLLHFEIPRFRVVVPAYIRETLNFANENYLGKLESEAREYLSR